MGQDLPTNAYALLGLLTLEDKAMTGYELKQRADSTLRFYWVAPAMSQIYAELTRLTALGLAAAQSEQDGAREITSYRITERGRAALSDWMVLHPVSSPVLKHTVCLRLLMGDAGDPKQTERMLEEYVAECEAVVSDLEEVRAGLRGHDQRGQPFFHPAIVADWGLDYYEAEARHARRALVRIRAD